MEFQKPQKRFRSSSEYSIGSHTSVEHGTSASAQALRGGIVDLTDEAHIAEKSSSAEPIRGLVHMNQYPHKVTQALKKETAYASKQPVTTHVNPINFRGISESTQDADQMSDWKSRMWPARAIVSFCRIVTRCRPPAVTPGKPVGTTTAVVAVETHCAWYPIG